MVNYYDLLESALHVYRDNALEQSICPSSEFTQFIRIHWSDYEPLNQQHDYAEYLHQILVIYQWMFLID
jgi:hypothetical protein